MCNSFLLLNTVAAKSCGKILLKIPCIYRYKHIIVTSVFSKGLFTHQRTPKIKSKSDRKM